MGAQGINWMVVRAMGAIGFGVGTIMDAYVVSPSEMHFAAKFKNLPYVPGVDTTQWGHYFLDFEPYVVQIPLADDQAWRSTWLSDGSIWVVMSGRHGNWQYAGHYMMSEDGMSLVTTARLLPGGINVSRLFRRVGNLSLAEEEELSDEIAPFVLFLVWFERVMVLLLVWVVLAGVSKLLCGKQKGPSLV